jgi:hypothetical protein
VCAEIAKGSDACIVELVDKNCADVGERRIVLHFVFD